MMIITELMDQVFQNLNQMKSSTSDKREPFYNIHLITFTTSVKLFTPSEFTFKFPSSTKYEYNAYYGNFYSTLVDIPFYRKSQKKKKLVKSVLQR